MMNDDGSSMTDDGVWEFGLRLQIRAPVRASDHHQRSLKKYVLHAKQEH